MGRKLNDMHKRATEMMAGNKDIGKTKCEEKFMFCKKCGRKLSDSSKFCGGCGSAVVNSTPIPVGPVGGDSPVTPTLAVPAEGQHKKPFSIKTLLLILIPAIVLVVAVVIAITVLVGNLGSGSIGSRNDILMTDHISIFREDGRTVVSVSNEETFTVNGEFHTMRSSMDGSSAIFLTDFEWEYGGTLWLATAEGAIQIAEDVTLSFIAPSGSGILYFTDWDERNEVAALYLYDVDSGRSRRLTNEAFHHSWENVAVISPDGKSAGFIVEESDNIFMGYLVINGETERLGENAIPVAIADNGRYVYFVRMRERDATWALYVRSENDEVRLARDIDMNSGLIFNQDLSQAIINVDGRALLSRNGEEAERLGNKTISWVVQPFIGRHMYWLDIQQGPSIQVSVDGIDSFANRIAFIEEEGDGNVIHINTDYEPVRIPGTRGARIQQAMIADNGSTLIFLDQDSRRLSRVALGNEEAEAERLARNVDSFRVSLDGRALYFFNELNELWFIDTTGDSHRVAEDVAWSVAMLADSHKIFFIEEYDYRFGGFLSYSVNGESIQRVSGADDVINVWITRTSVFYQTVDGDTYRSNGDGNFERVARGDGW